MRQIGEYIISNQNISKGAFATIHKGYHQYSKIPVAIKELKVININKLKSYVIRELEIHKKLQHPNIVKLYDVIIDSPTNTIYLIIL
jgi:serine/threonine-protein kinase ULK/ATG1